MWKKDPKPTEKAEIKGSEDALPVDESADPDTCGESASEDKKGEVPDEPEEKITDPLEIMQMAVESLTDRLQRNMAEFDNFRKRTARERVSAYDNGFGDAVEKILPVADNFERALLAFSEEERETQLYKGLDMIYRQLSGILEDMGVTGLPGAGEKFNPNLHHAVSHIDDESFGESVVVEELQKGYKYKDRVLRPGMVKVAN